MGQGPVNWDVIILGLTQPQAKRWSHCFQPHLLGLFYEWACTSKLEQYYSLLFWHYVGKALPYLSIHPQYGHAHYTLIVARIRLFSRPLHGITTRMHWKISIWSIAHVSLVVLSYTLSLVKVWPSIICTVKNIKTCKWASYFSCMGTFFKSGSCRPYFLLTSENGASIIMHWKITNECKKIMVVSFLGRYSVNVQDHTPGKDYITIT